MSSSARSRVFRRCCRRRSGAASSEGSGVRLPDTPLVLAGALGGPFIIFTLTPLRNALTLASQDAESSAWELYASTFHGGFANGWTGGFAPVLPSCPQFCVMGPLFHFLNETFGNVILAVLLSAMSETFISFSSQTLNAQMAYNMEQRQLGTGLEVPLWNVFVPLGPGAVVHVFRNIVGLAGIRIFAKPCASMVRQLFACLGLRLNVEVLGFIGDFVSSMCAAVCSAPINQCYNYAVTTPKFGSLATGGRVHALLNFLARNYLVRDSAGSLVGVSPTLPRDLFMRCAYVGTLYAMFSGIERIFVAAAQRLRRREDRREA